MLSPVDLVASATRSSFQRDKEERAVEAIEPASLSGVWAKARSSSDAFASSTTPARPMYSAIAVRLRRANTERISPPRSRAHTARPAIRLEAARYQCAEEPCLPEAVKWSASSAAAPQESTASIGFHVAARRPSLAIQA